MPTATDLDERVEVLSASASTNSIGETENTYSVERTEKASVRVQAGTERRFGGRPEEEAAVVVTMRKGAANGSSSETTVTRDVRLRYRGDDLLVHARREVGKRDRFVELETTRTRD